MTDSITETATRRLPPPGRLVRLWPRVKPYRWPLALATLALVASGILAGFQRADTAASRQAQRTVWF